MSEPVTSPPTDQGMLVAGTPIGWCLNGTEVSIVDYSRKERQFDGSIIVIERGFTDYVSFKVRVPSANVAAVRSLLASKRAVSTVYQGQPREGVPDGIKQAVTVMGYLNSFSISIDSFEYSTLTLEVEGEVYGTE